MTVAIWFTNDLRVYDNSVVTRAFGQGLPVLGFFIQPQGQTQAQGQFLRESLGDLSNQLAELNVPLVVLEESEVGQMLSEYHVAQVYTAQALNSRKRSQQMALENALPHITWDYASSETLLDLHQLEMSADRMDDNFTKFRKTVESRWFVSPCIDSPPKLGSALPVSESCRKFVINPRPNPAPLSKLKGGRAEGLRRLHYYLFESHRILSYKETRNGMLEFDDSSKFSPWLAHGCLSPKEIYWSIKKFESEVQANDSTYWLVFELLWRDYFKFLSVKYQDKFFRRQGISSKPYLSEDSKESLNVFELWKIGKTQNEFINANMIELLKTGWMSNRGRQNVASYLVKTLKIDWTWGADWFEKNLIDYDCENNWGNWLYQSGRGTDPRDRVFNPDLQAEMYDPQREYRRKWLQG